MKEYSLQANGDEVDRIVKGEQRQIRRIAELPSWTKGRNVETDEYGFPVVFDPEQESDAWIPCPYADINIMDWLHGGSPKWEGRLRISPTVTIDVSHVRLERLQDISHEDCIAQGVEPWGGGEGPVIPTNDGDHRGATCWSFAMDWERQNGEGSWEENPWVWVIEFDSIEVSQQ